MISFNDVTFTYAGATRPTLNSVSFAIPEGDLCLVVGRTGTGKSTLLSAINGLVPHFTGGTLRGRVTVAGRDTAGSRPRDLADVVGYVGQNPVNGFVTDTVEDEIAYGMEQLGLSATAMRKRVEETLDLLGIADLRRRALPDLSGGQQQRVAIASVLAAQPRVLVLDEPTSALDPTAAHDVLAAITTLVHEVGLTVVVSEHRLERVMHAADSMLWLRGDGSLEQGSPAEILARSDVVPPLAALARVAGWSRVPTSVREARRRVAAVGLAPTAPTPRALPSGPSSLVLSGVTVDHGEIRAVDRLSLQVAEGTVMAVMGRNGAGKSSLLWAIQGGWRSGGSVTIDGVDPRTLPPNRARQLVSMVPQSASDLLYLPTVTDECAQADRETNSAPGSTAALLERLNVGLAMDSDPRDASEGQRLVLVLAIQLVAAPRVLLLDEPTRGLDYVMKQRLTGIVTELARAGTTVLISTHDVEFAASATQRTVVLAEGEVVADGETHAICTSSPVYAPQLAKVFWPIPILTPDEVVAGLASATTANPALAAPSSPSSALS